LKQTNIMYDMILAITVVFMVSSCNIHEVVKGCR